MSTISKRFGFRTSCIATVINQDVIELDIGKIFGDFDDDAAPELRVLEHVGLIDRGHFSCAGARQVEGHAGDALDFGAYRSWY